MHHFVISTLTLTKRCHNENKISIFHYVVSFGYLNDNINLVDIFQWLRLFQLFFVIEIKFKSLDYN